MTPLLFGSPSRPLYGVLHLPTGRTSETALTHAVLLCAPFGQEAIRIHRLWRVLSEQLSRRGMAVFRFDHFGTGDSCGDEQHITWEGWQQDMITAHRELLSHTAASHITWLAPRLGATLSLETSSRYQHMLSGLKKLILWDPVVNGPDYLRSLRDAHLDALEAAYSFPDPNWRHQALLQPQLFTQEALGFALPQKFRQAIAQLTPQQLKPSRQLKTSFFGSDPQQHASIRQWLTDHQYPETSLEPAGKESFEWTQNSVLNQALVPAQALQTLLKLAASHT